MVIKNNDWKKIKGITDSFCKCDLCKKWERLMEVDEEGMRTIPLFNIIHNGKKIWVCEECWDKKQEEEEL